MECLLDLWVFWNLKAYLPLKSRIHLTISDFGVRLLLGFSNFTVLFWMQTSRDYIYCIYFAQIFWFRHTSISGRMLQFQADITYSGLLVTVAEATIEAIISAIIEKMITGRFPWLTRWISWFGYYTQLGNQIEPSPGINRMGYIFPMSHIPHPTSMYIVHGR